MPLQGFPRLREPRHISGHADICGAPGHEAGVEQAMNSWQYSPVKNTARQVLFGSAALATAQVVANAAAFFLAWAVARGMGEVVYGQFAAAYALAMSVAALADSGVRVTLIREVAQQPGAWKALLRNAMVVSILLAFTVAAGFFLLVVIKESPHAQGLRLWLLLFALLWTGTRILLGVPAGHQRLVSVAVWGAIERVGGALLVAALAFLTNINVLGLAQMLCTWEAGVLLAIWVWVHSRTQMADPDADRPLIPFVKLAIPFGMAAAVQSVMGKFDLIILGFQQAPDSVGHYAAAQMLALAVVFLGMAAANALFPSLAGLAKEERVEQARDLLEPALGLTSLVMIVVGAVLACIAGPLLGWVYGEGFSQGRPWLMLFALASPFAAVGAVAGSVIGAWGFQSRWMKLLLLLFPVIAAGYWLMGSWLGMWGVAVVNVAVQVLLMAVAWRWLSGAGLVSAVWLPKLLLIQCLIGIYLIMVEGWLLFLAPCLAIGLVFLLGVCKLQWTTALLRLAR